MMPMNADYVTWTGNLAHRVERMTEWRPQNGEVEGREIWITGQFTPWAERELKARAVAVHDHEVDVLAEAAHDLKKPKRGIIARLRGNKAGRTLERLADAVEN